MINQHRIGEAKARDAVGDLPHLLLRMRPCVALPWPQIARCNHLNSKHGHSDLKFKESVHKIQYRKII
jgi:hypothetical protein